MRTGLLFITVATILIASCKREQADEIDFGYDYLPLVVGQSIDYHVDSTVYDDFTQDDTTYSFTIRELVADTFTDVAGRLNYRIERQKQASDTSEFVVQKSFAIYRSATSAERLEDNKRTVILSFPLNPGSTWDGNAFNTDEKENFTVATAHKALTIGDLRFDSVATIEHNIDTANFVEKKFRVEKFARGIGLISIEYMDIETKLNGDSGLYYIQQIIP